MIDVLVYLFENFHDFSTHPQLEALARKLGAIGFEEKEILDALGWLAELKRSPIHAIEYDIRSTRILSLEESHKLGLDCCRFLVFLETAALTTGSQRELIIDRAMVLEDNPVPLGKFKIIVLMVLWSSQSGLEPLIVEELLSHGERLLAH